MFYKKFHQHVALFAIATCLQPIAFSTLAIDALAEGFEPPPNQPAPTVTLGGGRRSSDGKCPKDRDGQSTDRIAKESIEQRLTPLLPSSHRGFTVLANPTFFAYVPKTSAIAVEFTLENQLGRGIYQQRVNLTSSPAIISFQLPATTPLELGKDYKWLVSVVCETGDPEDTFSEGIVRRIQLNSALMAQLDKASASDRVSLYTKFGIWHEALAELAKLRLSQPGSNELQVTWQNLLKGSGLESLAKTPLKN
ncbi:DUF928 domain-containing protein [Tumidithrix elongata RA019]|uniref:DUF928 domain-containing protein n=1 Tax=Tumidithrix elongata BACA0141 TaxID=2716417 RepID=A0AAW9Q9H7_9CYAN|nr:DUF928 domain-containing protein [Tumidithrix elongata RA019]